MAIIPTIEEMVKDAVHKELEGTTINDIPLLEFLEKVNNAVEKKSCNITTCRYNADGKCTNEEKRKECVKVSSAVLCLDCDNKQKKNIKFDICDTNQNCENDPANCGYAVEYSTLEDVGNGIHKYMCGRDKCKYCK